MSGAGAGGGELAQFGSAAPASTPPGPAPAAPANSQVDAAPATVSSAPAIPAAPLPAAPHPAGPHSATNRGSLGRGIVYAVLAVFAGVAGGFMLRAGITSDNFPPFLTGEEFSSITKYSGPWLTAAAGAALLAGLLLLASVLHLTRWRRGGHRNDDARA